MRQNRNAAANEARGVPELTQLGGAGIRGNSLSVENTQAIRAELIGSDNCSALGIAAHSTAPVLALCRQLIEAGQDPATHDTEMTRLGALVAKMAALARRIGRVRMTASAAKAWEEAYPELSAERPGLVGAVIARAEAQVIRIALIYALLDCKLGDDIDAVRAHIDVVHLEAAMAVWAYCEASAIRIFGDSLGEPVADDILAALRRCQKGMTRTEIYNLFSRHRSSDQIAAALRMLLEAGCANFETTGTNGRPLERWFVVGGERR